jgi:hypothetical protein
MINGSSSFRTELAAMFTSWRTVRSYLFKRNAELGAVYVARLLEGARGLWDEYALTNGLLTTAQDELSETPGNSGRAKD